MTIAKGQPWGRAVPLPPDGVVVDSDTEASAAVTAALAAGAATPVIGLVRGDLCRTLGGRGDRARLRSADAVTFPIDLGCVTADGATHYFVAHAVAHTRTWTRSVAALNAAWLGPWNAGPRAHPNDGLLDVYDAHLHLGELRRVRARLRTGAHLPHPRIAERRTRAWEVTLDRPLPLWVDGRPVGAARRLAFRLEPDRLQVVV